MPSADQLARIHIVLVSPRNPLNIGAVARAMANFGFSQLTVVAPYEPHWREAQSAIGAESLLQSARVTETLQQAIAQATLVLGTATLTHRDPEQPVVSLPDAPALIHKELARGGRIALVFGPEKRGLTRQDLSYSHRLLVIPTDSRQPSMNLGQAVAVCLYEIAQSLAAPGASSAADGETHDSTEAHEPPPASAQLDRLAGVIEETMQAADYSPGIMREANRHDVNLLLRRLVLDERDARRILGLFRRVLQRLKR